MIYIGKWRWPLVVGIPVLAASFLYWRGLVRLNYEAHGILACAGTAKSVDADIKRFQSHPGIQVVYEKVPGHPLHLAMRADAPRPSLAAKRILAEGQASIAESLGNQKADFRKSVDHYQKQIMNLEEKFNQLNQDRKALVIGPKRHTPRAELVAKIEDLKARRRLLIAHYPTHSDIPVLANQIQSLVKQLSARPAPVAEKITEMDRQINETKVRMDYFSRRLQETAEIERSLKPSWSMTQPVQEPRWPNRVEGWPLGAGTLFGLFGLAFILFKSERRIPASEQGLWRPETAVRGPTSEVQSHSEDQTPDVERRTPDGAVALEVVSPEPSLPSDPLTEKAAMLYAKWVEVAKILYAPASEPPQGVLDSVGPLLQESSEFLPEGHDVLARYLAKSVEPGNLAAHVARTVLMTLTGAEEAGVSPEHRLAMALAALFHDLAVVPRPAPVQEDVGSEVGRLSASVLRRIPGLQPALLAMVEEILIGMDEFKLETWQNVANGSNLEPLSKVLREIDRFEKVMQKQKARLDRRVANQ